MNLNEMERKPEWPLIVTAVPCPTCRAEKRSPCVNLSAIPGTLSALMPREDWHSERKYVAVAAWSYFRNSRVTAESPLENISVDEGSEDSLGAA